MPESTLCAHGKSDDRSFLGHPRGPGYLAFTEAWERFSYYGMRTLLVLYMVTGYSIPGTSSTSPGSVRFGTSRTGAKVSIGWLIAFNVPNSIGFANVFPVSLALYARVAPAVLSATIIGVYYLHLFAANNLVGWLGGLLEKMPATNFWLLYAGLSGLAGIIFLVCGRLFGHLLAPKENGVQ